MEKLCHLLIRCGQLRHPSLQIFGVVWLEALRARPEGPGRERLAARGVTSPLGGAPFAHLSKHRIHNRRPKLLPRWPRSKVREQPERKQKRKHLQCTQLLTLIAWSFPLPQTHLLWWIGFSKGQSSKKKVCVGVQFFAATSNARVGR